uniref:Uncharacterized protein n=1 Tax=Romanomermis culicivorax TaxID=13658 RepID=A0A915KZ57_ROMCU
MRCTTYDEEQCPRNNSCQMRNFDQKQVSVCCPKPGQSLAYVPRCFLKSINADYLRRKI